MKPADLIRDLQRPWRHGEHVDGRDLVRDEPLVLDGMNIRGFDLSGADLRAGLSARNAKFQGLAWLRQASITGPADFTGATFLSDLRCDGLRANSLTLDYCRFQGVLSAAHADLDTLSLKEALCLANVTLEAAQIRDKLDLTGAEIMGGLWSAGAKTPALDPETAEINGRLRLPA